MKNDHQKEIQNWKTLKSREIFKTPYLNLTEDLVRTPGGKEIKYAYYGKGVKTVGIIPVLKDKKIPLIYQFRYPHKKYSWDLPGGKVDDGEIPKEAAKRELKEEMNIDATRFILLGKFATSPGSNALVSHIFLALDSRISNDRDDEVYDDTEFIQEMKLFTLEEIMAMVKKGEIYNAQTVLCLLLYKEYLSGK